MFELLLFTDELIKLIAASDAINVYEGDVPPAASFQVIDEDRTIDDNN